MKKTIFAIAILSSVVFTACKKDPDDEVTPTPSTPAATTGSISLNFEHMVDTNALTLNTVNYVTANNDTCILYQV
jgi:PBP1b-binding outer membrane lipoprotein LpoB